MESVKLRVTPPLGGYLFAFFVALFIVCFLLYIEKSLLALLLFVFSSLFVLTLSITDKIVFDGQNISRTGLCPRIWAYVNERETKISLDSINQVKTSILLTLKKSKRISYTYKTVICGLKSCLIVVSGGNDKYLAFMKALISAVDKEALDFSSFELGKYANRQEEVLVQAKALKLFPNCSSESLLLSLFEDRSHSASEFRASFGFDETVIVEKLRKIAGELKILGYLSQSLEAFRRALALEPKDAWLHFGYSHCLRLFAESEKDEESMRKAKIHLRLSRIYGKDDSEILTYIAETYLQYGHLNKARETFQMALEREEGNCRALLGLAEIALREGKVAHVIHHLRTAARVAKTEALKRWVSKEIAYFARLNSDLGYVKKEVNRIGWLEKIHFVRKLTVCIFLVGCPLIIAGSFYEQSLGTIGWTLSALSLLGWIGLNASMSFLTQRTPL